VNRVPARGPTTDGQSAHEQSLDGADVFAAERPRLVGLAYRMLGTFADAEDVVQDAWLRWQSADRDAIERPAAWLTTVTTRLALDRLRATKRRREEYVGPWLPEPIVGGPAPEATAELADSLTLGFLTLIDRLSPVDRAVFLLADVFGFPYAEVAETVDKSEAACRQIASRARRRLQGAASDARRPDDARERAVVGRLVAAVMTGDVAGVLAAVAPDVVLVSDGGPNRHAARRPVVGADRVTRFMVNLTKRFMNASGDVVPATVNGDPGLLLRTGGEVEFVVAFEVHDDRVAAIWAINNPDKLEHVGEPLALA